MKLHAAGMIEAHFDACTDAALPSVRPSTQGTTCTGTSSMRAARKRTPASVRLTFASAAARPIPARYRSAPRRHSSPSAARTGASVATTECQSWR
jgi:hypothetical protein